MKKPLKVALHKCERISDLRLYGHFTPVELLLLIDFLQAKDDTLVWKISYAQEKKAKGIGGIMCCSFRVTREQAENFPLSRYYR